MCQSPFPWRDNMYTDRQTPSKEKGGREKNLHLWSAYCVPASVPNTLQIALWIRSRLWGRQQEQQLEERVPVPKSLGLRSAAGRHPRVCVFHPAPSLDGDKTAQCPVWLGLAQGLIEQTNVGAKAGNEQEGGYKSQSQIVSQRQLAGDLCVEKARKGIRDPAMSESSRAGGTGAGLL